MTRALPALALLLCSAAALSQTVTFTPDAAGQQFPLVADGRATPIFVPAESPETVRVAAHAFAEDVERVTGQRPRIFDHLSFPLPAEFVAIGVLGHSWALDRLRAQGKFDTRAIEGKWEAAVSSVVESPGPGVRRALVIAGSDRRGAAYALFELSRAMGVSPWSWWADVPVVHHDALYVSAAARVMPSPSVQYRGIFLNDEDWGLRPWAAKKMDPAASPAGGNIGPNTYQRIFELLLRLHANSLWPAMHPGSLAFNAVPENARLADRWGIVMGSSHSEELLRNNVGEWSEKPPPAGDGPWNYQTNAAAMRAYWEKRLEENGRYENFYTVGLRGLHDSGLEATGTPEQKARLVEQALADERALLARHVNSDLAKVPQVLWLYKESLDLYRLGMKIPDDVTLGWTDDNYGYIRELPTVEEQRRAGGSGVYYHVSYWGAPHDYLWLCTTPPSLIREEMTKAYDHDARRYWILNVGDLKPAEMDIDYFLQLAADEPRIAAMSDREWMTAWFAQQLPAPSAPATAARVADLTARADTLNFIRRPEFMGFNGYNDGVRRTAFNPLAWPQQGSPDEAGARVAAWQALVSEAESISPTLPKEDASAWFELVGYPIEAAAAMNEKFLAADRTYLDAHRQDAEALARDSARSQQAYDRIQTLTAQYNALEGGKWDGMMSAHPRDRHVFEMPALATMADASAPLPADWGPGSDACAAAAPAQGAGAEPGDASAFHERHCAVSIAAAHFVRSSDAGAPATPPPGPQPPAWRILPDLGISGASVVYGRPGLLADLPRPPADATAPWLEYEFTTTSAAPPTLALYLLPVFPVDSDHTLRYAVSLDGAPAIERDAAAGSGQKASGAGDGPRGADWPLNVLRNAAVDTLALPALSPGRHTLRFYYRSPGVVLEHVVLTFPGAPPAYPVPPETH